MPSGPSDTPKNVPPAQRRVSTPQSAKRATVKGSGAVAQGSAAAAGERAVIVDGDNHAGINTGTQIGVVEHYHAAGESPHSRAALERHVGDYLRWLQERTQHIEMRGIQLAGGAQVGYLPLETAYVPLRARPAQRLGERGGAGELDVEADADLRESDIALNEVLGLGNRLVIVGGPGSGKTTVLMHMAWALATSLLNREAEPARSRLGLNLELSALPLPIFVPLALFARHRRSLAAADDKRLIAFISQHLIAKQSAFGLPADFFEQLLLDGRHVVLLLDGLDEVANERERSAVRQCVEELVSGRPAMRTIVTCRTIAYRNDRTALGAQFREVAVQPLDFELHIAPMVRQAYTCIHPQDPVLREERIAALLGGIEQLERDRRSRLGDAADALVDSPLMVRLLLIVHLSWRTLPNARADLFNKAIHALLQVDYERDAEVAEELSNDWKSGLDMAQHLAHHMHCQGPDQGRVIDEPALKAALREDEDFVPRIDAFLGNARQRGSVLEERDGTYRFIHLAFQEFLVARYLNDVVGDAGGQPAILAALDGRLADAWWREPILLLAGYKSTGTAKPARQFFESLAAAGATPDAQVSAAELAGAAALEWRESGDALRAHCARRIAALFADDAVLLRAKPVLRARAGDVLSQLGDPRFDAGRLHLPADDQLGFVRIPADPAFCIGTRAVGKARVGKLIGAEVDDDEINDAVTPTREFHIARYPVTVAQFRAFVEATNFQLDDQDALRDPGSRPVRYVTWHEASKYCAWLNEMLATMLAFTDCRIARLVRDHGWQVALPSEIEWEKAARGGLANVVFSWGDTPDPQRANYDDSGISDSSAVGCFAANPYGLHDMIGNVLEWTRSVWGGYPYPLDDPTREPLDAGNEVQRLVRGGAWYGSRYFARCAFRGGYRPNSRYNLLGFRVVLRSYPVS